MPSKKTKPEKKPKAAKAEDSDSDSEPRAPEPADSGDDRAPPKKAAAKASVFALMSDDDDEESEEDVPVVVPEKKPKKKPAEDPEPGEKKKKKEKEADKAEDPEFDEKKKKKKKDNDDPVEDADVAQFGEKKKKKDKDGDKAAEDGDKKKKKKKDDEPAEDADVALFGEKKKKKDKKKPVPTVCEVLEVRPVPKKDKLRLCKVRAAPDADPIDIVTNAPNIAAAKKFIVALPGVTTATGIEVQPTKVGGVESAGMFCSPLEMGWSTDVLDEKSAVMLGDDAEVGAPAPGYEEAVQAQKDREEAAAAAAKEEEAKSKKGKKKGGKGSKEDDEALDAILLEFKEEVKEEPAAAAGSKGKKKKGGKQAKPDDDDDDVFAEFKVEEKAPEPKEPEPATNGTAAAKPIEAPAEAKAGNEDGGEDGGEDEANMDAKTLANRRKKDKKKAKGSKAIGGEGMWGDDAEGAAETKPEEAQAAAPAAAAPPAPAPKKGGKEKKESAAVKAARERLEMQAKLDAEREEFERAERERIAEEERIAAEEERKIEEERARKRDARQAKIAKQKAEGTYQTKQQKLKAARAEELRKQFGFDMDEDKDEEEEEAPQPEKTKRPMAQKLKKKKKGPEAEAAEEVPAPVVEEVQDTKKEKPKEEPKEKAKPAAPASAAAAEEDDDGWEKEADEAKEPEEKDEGEEADADNDEEEEEEGEEGDDNSSVDSFMGYRSPIICIMGHVDTGKTKLLDKIRRTNVQENEAGGITQQIGATFFPDIALEEQTQKVDTNFEIEVPGLLIIDTPGHESFNNLRARGSSLCDMAILVIDIMHGLEPQTVESLEMLKKRRCPFIVALNKCDVLYQWNSQNYSSCRTSLQKQEQFVQDEFQQRYNKVVLQLNERGLNVALYWENDDFKRNISIVPTSALTGEGVPDLLYSILYLTQTLMPDKLEMVEELQCTVIEVKNIEGLGTTIDVVLLNGTLRLDDQIVIAGIAGPIVTKIRGLLTPQPMKEMRVKNDYVHHQSISTAMGVKICAPGLEQAVAGTELLVCGPDDDLEALKEEVDSGFESILADFEKEPMGVYVKSSTLGSLEALLSFLQESNIPVFDVGIGEVHKKDVKKANIMKDKKHPEYAVILAFDVNVNKEAKEQAKHDDVQIMTADIIYHLFDKFTAYMDKHRQSQKTAVKLEAVFPAMLQIDKVFRKADPMLLGCTIIDGQLRIGTPLCVPERDNLEIGRVGGMEKEKGKQLPIARRGDEVCIKIDQNNMQSKLVIGRHFDDKNKLVSKISRDSIDTLHEHFEDEMSKDDWALVVSLKVLFKIS